MKQADLFDEIIVDNFAGGGGASTGIELPAAYAMASVQARCAECVVRDGEAGMNAFQEE